MPVAATIRSLDLADHAHVEDLIELLDHYACDPFGGGTGLSDEARLNLARELQGIPTYRGALAFDGEKAIGLINCFTGFSTFAAKPLLNIHDLVVNDGYRGQGIGQALLDWAAQTAKDLGCCKLTLEVLSNNRRARRLYEKAGFAPYQLDAETGTAMMMQKGLA
jgi:ribosomal protein S18 acetylase RimI-like enzyme